MDEHLVTTKVTIESEAVGLRTVATYAENEAGQRAITEITIRPIAFTADGEGLTAKHVAAVQGHYETIVRLLSDGARVSFDGDDGEPPAAVAAKPRRGRPPGKR